MLSNNFPFQLRIEMSETNSSSIVRANWMCAYFLKWHWAGSLYYVCEWTMWPLKCIVPSMRRIFSRCNHTPFSIICYYLQCGLSCFDCTCWHRQVFPNLCYVQLGGYLDAFVLNFRLSVCINISNSQIHFQHWAFICWVIGIERDCLFCPIWLLTIHKIIWETIINMSIFYSTHYYTLLYLR